MPPASLRRAWKMRPWMQRLSGLTLSPSIQRLGVDAWISSLRVIRASHFPLPEENRPKPIPVTSGLSSVTSCAPSNPASASLKTSRTIYVWALNKSTMTYDQWVSALRRACLLRKKSVLLTKENGSLFWPTPRALEPGSTSPGYRKGLAETVRHWLTPRASESGERQDTFLGRMQDRTDQAHSSLTAQVKTWPTPIARDWKDTPGMSRRKTQQISLSFLAYHSGHHAPENTMPGDPSQMRLNPAFTEWLMGWPIGWTEFVPAATAWFLWQQRMRFALSQLLSIHDARSVNQTPLVDKKSATKTAT